MYYESHSAWRAFKHFFAFYILIHMR